MHLTRFTDLSLRVLIYLTHNERKGLVTVTELAERFKWPATTWSRLFTS